MDDQSDRTLSDESHSLGIGDGYSAGGPGESSAPAVEEGLGADDSGAAGTDREGTDDEQDAAGTGHGAVGNGEASDSFADLPAEEEDDGSGLFTDILDSEPIFTNKEVMRPSYTPQRLPHRSSQIDEMASILASALRGNTPSNILIYGKTGTGKTACAKYVSDELQGTSREYDVPCIVEYINCEVTDTQYRVLAQLANEFIERNDRLIRSDIEDVEALCEAVDAGETSVAETRFPSREAMDDRLAELEAERDDQREDVPMTGWPTDRVYNVFFEAVDQRERVVIIMLDEIDKLVEKSGDDTLYNLSRMNSDLENSRVSIMGISNDLKFTDFLDPRVKSSLGEEEILFPPYDATQLGDILEARAEVGFKDDALGDGVITLCSAFAAQEHGDARRALDLLRTAGELAERSKHQRVNEGHVREAQEKIELDRVVEAVRTLPTQSKVILLAIIHLHDSGHDRVTTGEVFNTYSRFCEVVDLDTLTQRRVTELISELDMLGIVNAAVVSKGRYGRTKEITLSVPKEQTCSVLLTDSRLDQLGTSFSFV